MTRIFSIVSICLLLSAMAPAQAQEALPSVPEPIQNLVNEGAQIRYLGKDHGLDAWLTLKNGVEQYFYVMPDQKAFVMGVLFDESGKLVTVQQVDRLRQQGGDALLDSLAEFPLDTQTAEDDRFELKTPSEQMFADIEDSNWIALGRPGAPVVYSFIDPQCPHCHAFIEELRAQNMIDQGQIQLRMIPVGFREESQAQAAFLMASPNPQDRWYQHMDGDERALPAKAEINRQGVQRNLSVMQAWKFDVTPLSVYRGKDGSVKIIRGKPQDINAVLNDLPAADVPVSAPAG